MATSTRFVQPLFSVVDQADLHPKIISNFHLNLVNILLYSGMSFLMSTWRVFFHIVLYQRHHAALLCIPLSHQDPDPMDR